MKPAEAKYIWFDADGQGYNPYGIFRKTFEVKGDVRSAVVNMFADTAYQLYVNGQFTEFGPVRFDPRFPLYDTHDIAGYLRPGKNVIAVKANFIGHKTFKSIPAQAGLVAWGVVQTGEGQTISLDTKAGAWKCIYSKAHSAYAPKLSFALNAAELYDQNLEEHGWTEADFDDSCWAGAVELKNQNALGELKPRSIPFMSGEPVNAAGVKVLPLEKHEDRYSFRLETPFIDREEPSEYSKFVAYTTWIYSPEAQVVTAGTWYGESWLNGKKVPRGQESVNKSMRINQRWELQKGWNHYFGCVNAYAGVVQQYIGLPAGKGFIVSADRDAASPATFRHTPLMRESDYQKYLKDKPMPYSSEEELKELGGWVIAAEADTAQSPCREASWDDFGEPLETLSFEQLKDHVFALKDYPDGFCLLLDLEQMHLFFPHIQIKGVKGAAIDFIYTEHLNTDNEHLRILGWVPLGDRVICGRDEIDWLPVQPRGARYMSITVRNIASDVTIQDITLRSASYPVEQKGYFRCSDPLLNQIWEMGLRTQAANMEDAYVDCCGRERGMYGRDSIIQYHANLATFGDQALMRRCMELFGQSPDSTGKFRAVYPNTGDYTIADFALNMLEGYLNYYENTGDSELIAEYWDAMMKNLNWFHSLADQREDLLLDSEWHTKTGIDAHYGGFHGELQTVKGHLAKTGIHCCFSITYLDAIKSALKLAQAIGKVEDAHELQRRADILSRTIPEKFWDEEKNCFKDNLEGTSHSVHANLMAARAGVASEMQLEGIRKHVRSQLRSLFVNGYDPKDGAYFSPNYAFYLFEGMYKAGLEDVAEHMMKEGWGWALAQGLRTCPEYFQLGASLCHAWSASPTWYLSKNVLGVRFPKAPDMNEVEIRIQTSSVTEAEGAFPHPRGLVEVKWHMDGDKRVFDTVKVPEGVKVKIVG